MRLFCASVALGLTLWASGLALAAQPYKLDVGGNVNITGAYHVNGVPISATSNWNQSGSDISYTAGNVGIGTAAPQTKFHAVGTSWFQGDSTPLPAAAGKGIAIGSSGDIFYLFAYDYPNWTPQNLVLNHPGGNVGIGTTDPVSGRLHVEGGNTAGDTAVYGRSFFGKSGIEGFSQTGDGVFGGSGVGSGVRGESVSGHGLHGESQFGYAGYFKGNVYVTGTVTQNSDVRLKQGVRNLDYGLHDVMQLRPVSYTWKQTFDGREQLGLLAQEVEAVVPELVTTARDADKTKGINYIGLLPVMIKAMQEQQDIITTLKSENASLDGRLKALEQALEQALQQSRTHQ